MDKINVTMRITKDDMVKFFHKLFSDKNDLNEKSILGYASFLMMVITLVADVVSAFLGKPLPIHEFVFQGFLVITLGAFGIAAVDKWTVLKHGTGDKDEEQTPPPAQ